MRNLAKRKELAQDEPSARVRRPGAGRKLAIVKDPTLVEDLEALVEPTTRGDPESPLRWTCKSLRRLAEALQQRGHQVSRTLVAELLNAAGYSLQGNRKAKEGNSHPDRDAQFAYINTQVAAALAENQDRFCLCGAIASDGNFSAPNRLIMVNRARILGNGRTVRFDRSALTRHTIDGAPGRGARVTPIRRWIEEPP
jgi:hypothetical protein